MTTSRAASVSSFAPTMPLWFVVSATLLAVTTVAQWLFPESDAFLRWQPDWLLVDQWRAITGHFAHLSAAHAGLNLLAWLALFLLFRLDWQAGDTWLMLASIPVLSVLMLWSSLDWYVGLSGVLHGWFLLGAVRVLPNQRWFAVLLLLALLVKLWWEPQNPVSEQEQALIGGPIAYVSHQLGALAMLILLGCQFLLRQFSRRLSARLSN